MTEEETKEKTVKKKTTKKKTAEKPIKEEISEKENKADKEEKENPTWVKLKPSEVEKIIIELAEKEKKAPAEIGIILRDKHGIPSVKSLLGKKIEKILNEKEIEYRSGKVIIQEKIDSIREHIAKNKQDHTASRALTKRLWALRQRS